MIRNPREKEVIEDLRNLDIPAVVLLHQKPRWFKIGIGWGPETLVLDELIHGDVLPRLPASRLFLARKAEVLARIVQRVGVELELASYSLDQVNVDRWGRRSEPGLFDLCVQDGDVVSASVEGYESVCFGHHLKSFFDHSLAAVEVSVVVTVPLSREAQHLAVLDHHLVGNIDGFGFPVEAHIGSVLYVDRQ